MIAEGTSSETPGGELPRPSERDLLAERRARRAAESADPVLARRAEAAEATVQALETHLASLQQRLIEAEEEARRGIERLAERENELRRVKQQEYAEQQLRVEAERALAAERADSRTEIIQRLQERVAVLERRATQLAEEIDTERRARERTEHALETMRESHATMAATVRELRDVAGKLRVAAERGPIGEPVAVAARAEPPSQARREEMADALATAVERLRARAEATAAAAVLAPPSLQPADTSVLQPPIPAPAPSPAPSSALVASPASAASSPTPPSPAPVDAAPPAAQTQLQPQGQPQPQPQPGPQSHKHSMSLIGRWRAARKHRRGR